MIIVGFDPGKASGYAVLDTEHMRIRHMEIANHSPFQCVDAMQDIQESYGCDAMVVENFIPRWGQKFDLDSVYLIGALQGMYDNEVLLVNPSTHMGVVPREKLTRLMKEQGYAIQAGHSRMGLSVAVYYAAFKLKDQNVLEFLADN